VTSEYLVYSELIAHLLTNGWDIVCACPPAGTDLRFQKCNLSRPGAPRGVRDEVDITAVRHGLCLLIECKGSVADTLERVNREGETDVEKLQRIASTFTCGQLEAILRQAHGDQVPPFEEVSTAVAFASHLALPVPGVGISFQVLAGQVTAISDDLQLLDRVVAS